MKKIIYSVMAICLSMSALFQATSAAFEETVTVAGSSFTVGASSTEPGVGNTALKLLVNVGGAVEDSNMADTINGPSFDNIDVLWTENMLIKIHNKGAMPLDLISKSNYVNDPDTLRDDIYVEIFDWNDSNNNGLLDTGELGSSFGHDTILRWRNDTFPLGEIAAGETQGFVLKFDGTGVTESNIGQSAVYDFVFTGMEQLVM